MNIHSTLVSSPINRSIANEHSENHLLEPLLSNYDDIQHFNDGLLVTDQPSSIRSICKAFLMKLGSCCLFMSSRSFRLSCLTSIKWIPVIFILAIVGWSYYAYVGQMCIDPYLFTNKKLLVIYLFIYHILLSLFLWSYLRTVLTKSLIPPSIFYLNEIDGENLASINTVEERRAMLVRLARQAGLQLLTRHFDGSIRYCFTCRCIKPDRAHHCSLCGRCVLRYDHHCPWTNSCISYGNYKYFVLFLAYTFLFCFFVAGTSFEYFLLFWQGIADIRSDETKTESSNGKFHILFLFFVSIMFGISVSSLLFYHLYLTAKNRTTLESFRVPIFATGPEKNGFNLGYKRNFQEIFGQNIFKGFLPIPTTLGDGIHYQINYELINGSEQTNASAMTLLATNSKVNNSRLNHSTSHQNGDFLVDVDPCSTTSNTENQNERFDIQNLNDAQ